MDLASSHWPTLLKRCYDWPYPTINPERRTLDSCYIMTTAARASQRRDILSRECVETRTNVSTPKNTTAPLPLHKKLVVGAIAGFLGTLFIYPMDMVKTQLQNQKSTAQGLVYKGPLHAARTIVATEGYAGLYRGLSVNLGGVIPQKAINLAANEVGREFLEDSNGTLSIRNQVLAGAFAGLSSVVVMNPMEIVKIRVQVQGYVPVANRQTPLEVVQRLGIRGLYTGVGACLLRDVPFSILFFPLYANLKDSFADSSGNVSFSGVMGSGLVSGALASGLVTPADVVKTRLQVAGGSERYSGLWDCAKTIVKEEGPRALFKGAGPRMAVMAPLFGIALSSFELQKRYVNGQFSFQSQGRLANSTD